MIVAMPQLHSVEAVTAALAVGDVAAVVLRPAPGGRLEAATTAPFVCEIQARNAAALIVDDARLARTIKADGVHLSPGADVLERYREAREILGGRQIAGADAGASRHAAMELAEAGADYVAFGLSPDASDHDAAVATRLGLVAWWAEIFEPPVVGLDCADVGEAASLSLAGADFVSLALPAEVTSASVASWLGKVIAAIGPAKAMAKAGGART
jgi:thiamine-phosphate pyrophosphorylase